MNRQTQEEFTKTPEEISSDFVVETERADTTEIPAVPENPFFTPAAPENPFFNPAVPEFPTFTDEQAASDDRYNFDGDYNVMPESERTEEELDAEEDYRTEAADDYYGEADDAEYFAPEDEQAASVDRFDESDGCEKCKLDDYEIISDVLGSEKQIVKLYSSALCEAAEENFRNVLRENLDYATEDQYKAFEFMQRRGMYKVEQASDNDLSQAKQQLSPLCENSNIGWKNNGCGCDVECGYDNCGCDVECGCDNCNCETTAEYADCDPCCGDGACDIDE